ncbi:MAG: chromosome segregation protein SMC [Polyangiaceae bacterium]
MHIKKIEIAGFKSFVDRTVIHFDHDVIGIVGPNGCGKSNIVDSIRWCMGEQSAKHLRGRAMEDVIFNGSESRGPHGFAEVTITFDNTASEYAATLPEEVRDFPEIAITRRLFRDGTSEYLINKTQVRLRDVTDLFLGTGVGTKAYSIIEQGRVGQIVSARPVDRRLFLEEAAGITKYKQRRKQAERKMDLTRQNLLRITDIVNEIDRTRASLRRQAAKAERFVRYREELDELMLHDASHRLLEMIVMERVERTGLETSKEQVTYTRGALEEEDQALATARAEAQQIEQRADQASRAAFETDNEVTTLQGEIQRSMDRLGHLAEREKSAAAELLDVDDRILRAQSEGADVWAKLEELETAQRSREADTEAEDTALADLHAGQSEAEAKLAGFRQELAEARTGAATATTRLEAIARRVSDARVRLDKLSVERETLDEEHNDLLTREAALAKSVAELAEGRRISQEERAELEAEAPGLKQRVQESEKQVEGVKNELSQRKNRLRALEDLHRRLDGVGSGVRSVLGNKDGSVLGLVADRIEAPEDLTDAFASLLGDRLQSVVVTNPERGLELLDQLKQGDRGRATLLPQRPRYVAGSRQRIDDPRVLGWLVDRLRYAPEDEALVQALVGDAVLVQSSADAVAVSRARPGCSVVALDGTVVRADGSISGGSRDDVAAGMVEQKHEMRVLAEEVAQLSATLEERLGELHALKARLTELSTSLDQARQFAHEGELAHIKAEKDLAQTRREIEALTKRRETLEKELVELTASVEGAAHEESDCRDLLTQAQHREAHVLSELTKAETAAQSWRERVAAQTSLLTERKVHLAQVKEQYDAARESLERIQAALTELFERQSRLADEVLDSARNYGRTAAGLVLASEARIAAELAAEESHKELADARELLDQVRHALSTKEDALKHLRGDLDVQEEAAQRHSMALQRMEIERGHLLQGIRERFRGLDLNRVVGDYHKRPAPDEEHRRRIDELSKLIDRMGPVNLDAQTEYEDAERRFAELNDQKVDIDKALAELTKAIRHMDKESRRRFKETFDNVNTLFKETFSKLFRGGRGELRLTDPENLLETGVEIMAQPPGKKLGNIELMSGGEKALTATALIFSMFRHRPSPFCVLDEVDAPLDEANVARYNEMVRAMTHRSQFILITHIKKTMQSVDVLYGVTMGEPGVSRIVSVKVNEQAGSRSEQVSALEAKKSRSEARKERAEQAANEARAQREAEAAEAAEAEAGGETEVA